MLERIGFDALTERDLFFLALARPADLPRVELTSQHFACFIAWDSEPASAEEISSLVEPLINAGAAYFCTWGKGCQRVHDIVDEIDAYPYDTVGATDEDSVIMTTWHENESLEDALYFFLTATSPAVYFEATFKSSLAISVGSQEWASAIRYIMADTEAFRKRIESNM